MPQGPESLNAAATGSVDPLLLAIVLLIFVVGAVVPLAGAIVSSMRDDQAARNAAQDQVVTNPVPDDVAVAVEVVELEPIGPDTLSAAANDDSHQSVAGGAG